MKQQSDFTGDTITELERLVCHICGARKRPHEFGCMYRTCTFGPHGEVLRDPLRQESFDCPAAPVEGEE